MIFSKQISFARSRSDAVVKVLDANHLDEHKAKRAEHKSLPYYAELLFALLNHNPEATRYSNPLKQKFKLKRMAAEGTLSSSAQSILPNTFYSRRWCCSTCTEAAECANARRVSPTKQDLVSAEFARKRQQGATSGALHPVRPEFQLL